MDHFDFWSDENRQRAANAVYDSISMLEKLEQGWCPDQFETPEKKEKMCDDVFNANLGLLKNALESDYYGEFLDRARVEEAIKRFEGKSHSDTH